MSLWTKGGALEIMPNLDAKSAGEPPCYWRVRENSALRFS